MSDPKSKDLLIRVMLYSSFVGFHFFAFFSLQLKTSMELSAVKISEIYASCKE